MLAEHLAAGERPALVYVVANFDNPSGSTLSPPAASTWRRWPTGTASGSWTTTPTASCGGTGRTPVALRHLTDRVITLGSTSKVLSPGLRVGWAIAPVDVRRSMTILKQSTDLHTGSLNQQIVLRVLSEPGFLDAHLTGLRDHLRAPGPTPRGRARTIDLGDHLQVDEPDGGMFLWAELADPDADTAELLPRALEAGVAFVPGAAFGVDQTHPRRMRLSYATVGPAELDRAVELLVGVITRP